MMFLNATLSRIVPDGVIAKDIDSAPYFRDLIERIRKSSLVRRQIERLVGHEHHGSCPMGFVDDMKKATGARFRLTVFLTGVIDCHDRSTLRRNEMSNETIENTAPAPGAEQARANRKLAKKAKAAKKAKSAKKAAKPKAERALAIFNPSYPTPQTLSVHPGRRAVQAGRSIRPGSSYNLLHVCKVGLPAPLEVGDIRHNLVTFIIHRCARRNRHRNSGTFLDGKDR